MHSQLRRLEHTLPGCNQNHVLRTWIFTYAHGSCIKYCVRMPEKKKFKVTISIGISELGLSTGTTDHNVHEHAGTLVDTADQALLNAKEGGRNRVVCAEPSLAKVLSG